MNIDDFVKHLRFDEADSPIKTNEKAGDVNPVISAMLVDCDEEKVTIDFLASVYKISRSDIIDVLPATQPVVTRRQRGYAVQLTLKGDAIISRVNEFRASDFDKERPFVLQQPSQVPMKPLESLYTPKEFAWLSSRGLINLAATTQVDPTSCSSRCDAGTDTHCDSSSKTRSEDRNGQWTSDDIQSDGWIRDDQNTDQARDDWREDDTL